MRGDDEDFADGPALRIVEERPPLREGKILSSTTTSGRPSASVSKLRTWRSTTPSGASGSRRRWSWVGRGSDWDEADVDELESLTLGASGAVEQAWRTLSAVMEAHSAQEEAALAEEHDDSADGSPR